MNKQDKPQVDEELLLTDQEIRLCCMGKGIYYAAEEPKTAADRPEFLMPMFRNVSEVQLLKAQQHYRNIPQWLLAFDDEFQDDEVFGFAVKGRINAITGRLLKPMEEK